MPNFDTLLDDILKKKTFSLMILLLNFLMKVNVVFHFMIPIFINYKEDYSCDIDNSSHLIALDSCSVLNVTSNVSFPCSKWKLSGVIFKSTIRSQYELFCDREIYSSLSTTSFMMGYFFGCLILGCVADWIGRAKSLILCSIVLAVVSTTAPFVEEFWLYNILKFVIGLCCAGLINCNNSYLIEVTSSKQRLNYFNVSGSSWPVASVTLIMLAYFIRNQFTLQLTIGLVSCISCGFPFLMPESPRWLLSTNQKMKAFQSCKRIAKINGTTVEKEKFDEFLVGGMENNKRITTSIWKLFKFPVLRKITFGVWFCYSVAAFVYFILILGSGDIGGNVFINLFLMSVLEIPARIFLFMYGDKLGRIPILSFTFIAGGMLILICAPIYKVVYLESLVVVLCLASRFLIGLSYDLICLYSLEIFPTVIRSSGTSSASVFARIATLISPQMELLTDIWTPLPFLISGILPLISGILSWLIFPETTKMETKNFIEECEIYFETHTRGLVYERLCPCKDQKKIVEDSIIEIGLFDSARLDTNS